MKPNFINFLASNGGIWWIYPTRFSRAGQWTLPPPQVGT